MIAREGDGHHHDVVLSVLVQPLDGVDGLRSLPGLRPDFGLPGEAVAGGREGPKKKRGGYARGRKRDKRKGKGMARGRVDERVSVPKLGHDGENGGGDLGDVGIASTKK